MSDQPIDNKPFTPTDGEEPPRRAIPPNIMITIEGGVLTHVAVDRMMIITIVDHDVKAAGGTIGETVRFRPPDQITPDIPALVRNTINELIDEGY
ncbi:MAG: hypothetical protein IH600_15005 [Bacteroidetes bacterium]|nr:hypothetical protein [Bacteroidota bacterium]